MTRITSCTNRSTLGRPIPNDLAIEQQENGHALSPTFALVARNRRTLRLGSRLAIMAALMRVRLPCRSPSGARRSSNAGATEANASPRFERQNPARRHYYSGEPLLQQFVLRLSRGDDHDVRLQRVRREDYPATRRARNKLGYRSQFDFVLRFVQRHGQHSRHELPDERLR